MALKVRGENIYCYLPVRREGRVTTEYLGAGSVAVLAQRHIDQQRAGRRAACEARRRAVADAIRRLGRAGRGVTRLSDKISKLFTDAMMYGGFYLHKRQWRRRGTMKLIPDDTVFDDARRAERARLLFEMAD